jgi:hypothetical protein
MTTWKCEDCRRACPNYREGKIAQIDADKYCIHFYNPQAAPFYQTFESQSNFVESQA